MKKILGTGLSGLVGSRIVELLSSHFEFEDLSFDTGVDITDKTAVISRFKNSESGWVLHLAAKTDVDACEKDKELKDEGKAWKINVGGTKNIVEAAEQFSKKVIYVSTDFVFDGKKDFYTENDQPNPISWYGKTKFEGEKIVLTNPNNIVIRISYPYRAKCGVKTDFMHAILRRLEKNQSVIALSDHVFTPTFIDDIANAIDKLIETNQSGIFHVNGSTSLTPYQATLQMAKVYNYSVELISKTIMEKYFQGRALRPLKLRMNNAKIVQFGVKMKTFAAGLQEIKKQGLQI